MVSKKQLDAINKILTKKEIRQFVEQNNISNEEILEHFGKFLYVYEQEGFILYKDSIISVVKKQENMQMLNYLFAPQNEKVIFEVDKKQLWGERKIEIMTKFITKIKNTKKGIYLQGNVGCGKTFLTMHMAKILIGEKKYTTFISMYQYLRFILDHKDRSFVETTLNSKYLFLDDLGSQSVTNFYLQELFFIIDYRYKLQLPIYISSNYSLKELGEKFAQVDLTQAQRIISRLKDMLVVEKI